MEQKEEVPMVVDHSILTDWSGVAKCIIKTVKVDRGRGYFIRLMIK